MKTLICILFWSFCAVAFGAGAPYVVVPGVVDFSTNGPLASGDKSGFMSSNQFSRFEAQNLRIPTRMIYGGYMDTSGGGAQTETNLQLAVYTISDPTNKWYQTVQSGGFYICMDDLSFSPVRDGNGNLIGNTNIFPVGGIYGGPMKGWSNFIAFCHTPGAGHPFWIGVGTYVDISQSATTLAGQASTFGHEEQDAIFLTKYLQFDSIRVDPGGHGSLTMAQVQATNFFRDRLYRFTATARTNRAVLLDTSFNGTTNLDADGNRVLNTNDVADFQDMMMYDSVRFPADVSDYAAVLGAVSFVQSGHARWEQPGHTLSFGAEGGSSPTRFALYALFHCADAKNFGFQNELSAGPEYTFTDRNYRAIYDDPLVAGPEIVSWQNGILILKTRLADGGYGVGIFNTNAFSTNVVVSNTNLFLDISKQCRITDILANTNLISKYINVTITAQGNFTGGLLLRFDPNEKPQFDENQTWTGAQTLSAAILLGGGGFPRFTDGGSGGTGPSFTASTPSAHKWFTFIAHGQNNDDFGFFPSAGNGNPGLFSDVAGWYWFANRLHINTTAANATGTADLNVYGHGTASIPTNTANLTTFINPLVEGGLFTNGSYRLDLIGDVGLAWTGGNTADYVITNLTSHVWIELFYSEAAGGASQSANNSFYLPCSPGDIVRCTNMSVGGSGSLLRSFGIIR